jgi:hypothetical protein
MTTVRQFVTEARDNAKASTRADLIATAASSSIGPPSLAGIAYAEGLRDGVVLACEQVLAHLDEETQTP